MLFELMTLTPIFYYFHNLVKENNGIEEAHKSIPIRIFVNGIRGKTSTTRMIHAVLRNHYSTIGKTTGSEPVIIYSDGSEERIKRVGFTNINEQIRIMRLAHEKHAEAVTFECMAIEPSYQKLLEDKVMKSTIGVITNIRFDHEDVMGESLESIALSLSNTIPTNGILVVPENIEKLDILQKVAENKNTKVILARLDQVPEGYEKRFAFMNFRENVTIVLTIANILGIDKEDALNDMLKTRHDIGKGNVYTKIVDDKSISFVNSFANNDIGSLSMMLSYVDIPKNNKKIALLNHRTDRMRRTYGFINFLCTYGFDTIVIAQENDSTVIESELRLNKFKGEIKILTPESRHVQELLNLSNKKGNTWIGLANIKSEFADSVMRYFETY